MKKVREKYFSILFHILNIHRHFLIKDFIFPYFMLVAITQKKHIYACRMSFEILKKLSDFWILNSNGISWPFSIGKK